MDVELCFILVVHTAMPQRSPWRVSARAFMAEATSIQKPEHGTGTAVPGIPQTRRIGMAQMEAVPRRYGAADSTNHPVDCFLPSLLHIAEDLPDLP